MTESEYLRTQDLTKLRIAERLLREVAGRDPARLTPAIVVVEDLIAELYKETTLERAINPKIDSTLIASRESPEIPGLADRFGEMVVMPKQTVTIKESPL